MLRSQHWGNPSSSHYYGVQVASGGPILVDEISPGRLVLLEHWWSQKLTESATMKPVPELHDSWWLATWHDSCKEKHRFLLLSYLLFFFLSKTYIPRIVTFQRFLLQGQKGHRNCQKAVAEFSRVSQSNDCESSPNGEDDFQWIDVLCGTTCTRIHTRAFGYWKQVAAGARNMFNTCIIYICISIRIYLCYI